jgi:hypothetical protein
MIKVKKHGRIAAKKMHNRQYGQYSKMANHYLLEQQDMGLLNFIFIHNTPPPNKEGKIKCTKNRCAKPNYAKRKVLTS